DDGVAVGQEVAASLGGQLPAGRQGRHRAADEPVDGFRGGVQAVAEQDGGDEGAGGGGAHGDGAAEDAGGRVELHAIREIEGRVSRGAAGAVGGGDREIDGLALEVGLVAGVGQGEEAGHVPEEAGAGRGAAAGGGHGHGERAGGGGAGGEGAGDQA